MRAKAEEEEALRKEVEKKLLTVDKISRQLEND